MKQLIKKKTFYFVKIAFGIGLVAWILLLVDRHVFFNYFQQLTLGTVLLIGSLSIVSLYFQYLRWKYLLNCNSNHFGKEDLIPSFFAGFTFQLMLPGGHAEISKIFLLPGKKKGKVAAFGLEKLILTFIKLFLVLVVLPLTFPQSMPYCSVLLLVLTVAILLVPRLRFLKRFQEKEINYYTVLSFTLVFSLLTFFLMVSQYYILLNQVNAISIWPTIHTMIYLWGSGVIPISISGLGVREGLAAYFFNGYGINPAHAVAISLFLFILGMIIPALIGIYFISKKKEHFREMKDVFSSTWDFIKENVFLKQRHGFPLKSLVKSLQIINIKITRKRIVNVVKIFASMFLSKILRKQVVWGYPLYLMVEPTNICNLKCPMCPSGNGEMTRALGKLNFDHYKKLIDDVGDYVLQVQLWNQGEPLINKSFLDFVKYANSKGIMTQTSTNGHFIRNDKAADDLVLSGLDVLIFSMDGTNQETYEKYRVAGNYNLVFETLERIGKAKKRLKSKTPLVELQFIVFKHNQGEMDNLIEIAKQHHVNRISFKTAQVYSNSQAETFLPDRDDLQRYKRNGDSFEMNGEIKNWCKRLWLNSTINWDGSVAPCCFDKDADNAFANVFQDNTSFRKVWKNGNYSAFRKQVMSDRKSIEMCTNCTEGLKVPYTKIIELSNL